MPRWASGQVGQPSYWKRAKQELCAADPVLGAVIVGCGRGGLVGHGDPYITLARSIVAQQISVRAADSIWQRFESALGAISPEAVAARSEEELRAVGLTRQKAGYLRELAVGFVEGHVGHELWAAGDDEAVISELSKIRGIGRWTAEMFLIFHLLRPDVLPLADIGIRRATAQHYADGAALDVEQIANIAERWRPWRSVATWYLWRSLDPVPVTY